jgi:hypothetical protein
MPVTTSSRTEGANMVTMQLKAITSIEAGATIARRIGALHPSHLALGSLARPFTKHYSRLGSAPMTLTKYNGKTKPKLWLADFRLACQLGGATDDRVII